MADLESRFQAAANAVKECQSPASNDDKLELYGLFKQATVGDNTTAQPWAVQVEARSKWEAWEKNKGKSADQAKEAYIAAAQKFIAKYK